jgi:mono/diheme cytochrome c family protein
MRWLLASMAFACLPAAAQDAARGKLIYQTQCGGCHYERVHERPPGRSSVLTLADLRDEVARRAALTGRPFTLDDLSDIAEYLNQSHYRFGLGPRSGRELIYGAELMSAAEREQYRRDIAAAGEDGQARVREQHRQRIRARARQRGVELAEPAGIVRK